MVFGRVQRLPAPLLNGRYHCLTLSLSFPICKWGQKPLSHRVAVSAPCLGQGRHSAGVHTLSLVPVGGAHSYQTPSPQTLR